MRTEILLAVYNEPRVTQLTLEGYRRQTDRDFSIAIADDGSTDEIRLLVDQYRPHLNLRHLWQEDHGFRKTVILNKAIESSQGDYLIFSDNDCIPSRHFVADHKAAARAGYFVNGRRVDLGPAPAQDLLSGLVSDPENGAWLLRHFLRGQVRGFRRAYRPPVWLTRLWSWRRGGILGANLAAWREDLLAVNGFDEDFQGYGSEETDLEWRLLANGVRPKTILGRATLFHMYHPQRAASPEALERLREKRAAGKLYPDNGIHKEARPAAGTGRA